MSNNLNNKEFIDMMVSVAKEEGIKLNHQSAEKFIDIFSKTMKKALCSYPSLNIDALGYFAISRLSNRKRVLRNKEYWTKTFYKVRYYVTQEIQDALFEQYETDMLDDKDDNYEE